MADYIDRETVLKILEDHPAGTWRGYDVYSDDVRAIMRKVDEQPAADVAPVRRGHWIPIYASELTGWNPEFTGCDPIAGYRCSRCGADAILSCNDDFVLSNYCPNCGAKMEANHGLHHQIPL